MAKRWSEEEITLLKQHYQETGTKILKTLIHRSTDTIQNKAATLGLRVNNYCINNPEIYVQECISKNIEPIEPYLGVKKHILHRCLVCLNEWVTTPDSIRMGSGCPKCGEIKRAKARTNSKEFVEKILEENNLTSTDTYIDWKTLMLVTSKLCGHSWKINFNNIQHGKGCPICNKGFGYISTKENMPKVAYLYVYKITLIDTTEFIKVGVTISEKNTRLNTLRSQIPNLASINEVVKVKNSGLIILELEDKILNKSNLTRYYSSTKFSGYTELLQMQELQKVLDIIKEVGI